MSWLGTLGVKLGAGRRARQIRPATESSRIADLASIFGEANPAQITETPRPVNTYPAPGGHIASAPLAVANGWIDSPKQTGGMSVLYVDSVQRQPDPAIQGITSSTIRHSSYAPYYHLTHAHWLYSRWDPIYRFANTALDMRFAAGHIAPLTNAQPGNIAGSARMGPYATPFRQAWLVPRFSTEPNTVIPQSGN